MNQLQQQEQQNLELSQHLKRKVVQEHLDHQKALDFLMYQEQKQQILEVVVQKLSVQEE